MRKLLQTVLGLCMATCATDAYAQGSTLALMGPRLFVNSPSVNAGLKDFTFSSDATPKWGGDLNVSVFNAELVKGLDSLACGPLSNNVTGKWVLIYRGTCEFGQKAKNVQDKGAAGVIIVNNVAGAPVGMAAGSAGNNVTIPVLMISKAEGDALNTTLNNGQQVFISLTNWGFNNANDLAFIPKSEAPGPGSIPLEQWKTGTPNAYKFYSGAFVANVGTNDQTNVKLKSTITFTPTGGSATQVYADSVTAPTFDALDSAIQLLSPRSTSFNPTGLGKYTITYNVSCDATDDNPFDNTSSYTVDVTSNVFSRVPLDAAGNPVVTNSIKAGATTPLTWGPLYYLTSNVVADVVKLAINDNDTNKHALNTTVGNQTVYILKWTDGTGGANDGVIQSTELTIKAAASRDLTTADSNNQVLTIKVGNPDGTPGTVVLDKDSWYWVVADLPDFVFLGCNNSLTYFNRTNAAKNATTPVNDFWAPAFFGSTSTMLDNGGTIRMIPFGVSDGASANIDSATFTGVIGANPAITMVTSPFNVGVANSISTSNNLNVYPNPAKDNISVSISLDNTTHRADIMIVDAVGRCIYADRRHDIKNEKVSINTSGFVAGNYYVVFINDNNTETRPFTIISK